MRTPLRTLSLALALLLAAGALPAVAQLGIDLSPDEKKGEKKKDDKKKDEKKPAQVPIPPPPSAGPAKPPAKAGGFEALDVGAGGRGAARLAAAKQLLADKNVEGAALALDAILRDRDLADVHDEARFQLAVALARGGLTHSALSRLDEVLSRGAQGSKFFQDSLEWLFYLGRQTANDSVILPRVARYAGETAPAASRDELNTFLARYNYERGLALSEAGQVAESRRAYQEARRLASLVRGEAQAKAPGAAGNLPARALFVEGLVQYAQGDAAGAIEAFKEVVRQTNPRRAKAPDARIRELAFLQLARVHYEHKQNRYAIFYYQRMPWDGPSWLEGLWESSYAYYRIGDYEKALGNLITLQSPYFADEYFPESHLLKAIIYYENCRYPEARAILAGFNASYEPVFGEMERLLRAGGPAALLALLGPGTASAGPAERKVRKALLTDRHVERLDASMREIRAEIQEKIPRMKDPFPGSPLAQDLRKRLEAELQRLSTETGARAAQKLEYERDALRGLLQQALRVQIEVSRKEREALEAGLAAGTKLEVVRPYRFSAAVSDEHLYWPYEGEFWRDELGTYTYTLTQGCREGPTAPGGPR